VQPLQPWIWFDAYDVAAHEIGDFLSRYDIGHKVDEITLGHNSYNLAIVTDYREATHVPCNIILMASSSNPPHGA